jgi:hypothetical protein
MATLVTLAIAKEHLRITHSNADADLTRKLTEASDMVVGYIGTDVAALWTDADVPTPVRSAVLLLLTHLYDHRGEDMSADAHLWEAIGRLLLGTGYRDPTLA